MAAVANAGGSAIATPAHAAYGPGAEPASALGTTLADRPSRAPVISGDGRYVAFTTESEVLLGRAPTPGERIASGLVRKDTLTGAVELIAPPQVVRRSDGEVVDPGTPGGAAGISADGRYVLFATSARLSPDDRDPGSPDVYVRDMHAPLGPEAFALVSARDGGDQGIDYAAPERGSVPGIEGFALSADGRRAVFVTESASDLPARPDASAPEWQVWVRDLDARTTRLVSRDRDDASAAGTPAPAPSTAQGGLRPVVAISADGGTVVWTAGEAQRQTPTLPGEGALGPLPSLLVRELAPDAVGPARRVAGAVDLDDPACDPLHGPVPTPTSSGPCAGPFVQSEGRDQTELGSSLELLGVSGDGRRVLFSSSAGRRPYDFPAHRPGTAYLSDLRPGVSRKAGVAVLWSAPQLPGRHPLIGGTLSADGRTATVVSRDNRFDGLQSIGTMPSGNLVTYNLYAVAVDARTVERVTVGHDGRDYSTGDGDRRPGGPLAVSADGGAVAFGADDGNLFVGDANGVTDVLVVRRAAVRQADGPRLLPPADPPPVGDLAVVRPLTSRFLSTRGALQVARRTGTATVRVQMPSAGRIVATATGTVTRSVRRDGRSVRRSSTVRVARVSRTIRRAQTITLRVPVSARARTQLRRPATTMRVRLTVRFTPTGQRATTLVRSYRLRTSHAHQGRTTR